MNENVNEELKLDVELTAGEMLRMARTTGRRKREIPTISKQLCIREEFLQALEDGNYTVIPEVVYILGFARNYAMELGLNPDEIVAKIKNELGITGNVAAAAEVAEAAEKKKIVSAVSNGWHRGISACRAAWGFVCRHWKWTIAVIILLVAIVVGFMLLRGHGDTASVAPVENAPAVTAPAAPTRADPKFNHDVRERFGTENRETANVIIQATGESWLEIKDARGRTAFSRVLVAGDVYYVPADDRYKGTFGNAGVVDVWVNGELAPALGAMHTRATGVSMAPDSLMKKKSE